MTQAKQENNDDYIFLFAIAVMHSFCAEFPMSVLKSVLWIKWSISLWCFYGMYVGVSL